MNFSSEPLLLLLAFGLALLVLGFGLYLLIWLIFEQRNWIRKNGSLSSKPKQKSNAGDPVHALRAKGM